MNNGRDFAYCAMFGSLALALPMLFHAFGGVFPIGPVLLPMYWPLMALAFLAAPRRAALTAAAVPWASALLCGMPLLWPPFAAVTSVELLLQVYLVARFGRAASNAKALVRALVVLAVVLSLGRFLHAALVYALAQVFELPARALAAASLLAGWPGVFLICLVTPVFAAAVARRDGVCEVRFIEALRRMHLGERTVLACAQALRWFEALARDAGQLARALELRTAARRGASVEPLAAAPVVVMRGVKVCYPNGRAIAFDDLELPPGGKLALTGPNGCGKTTLLQVLSGFIPYEGEVKVFGLDVKPQNLRTIRARLGVVFENPDDQFLFPTLREDVGYAAFRRGLVTETIDAEVDARLAEVGLERGNRPVAALSRGQRQRAALAGVLAASPELLLLDEPTASLDVTERRRIANLLASTSAAVIVATHDEALSLDLEACRLNG